MDPTEQNLNATVVAETTPRGDLISELVAMIETRSRSTIMGVDDPVSNAKGLILFAPNGGATALPASVFDEYLDGPRYRRGTASLTNLDSFIGHVNRFRDDESMVFACDDRTKPSLTAVFDYHGKTRETTEGRAHQPPRFLKHHSTFAFPLSDEWKSWNKHNGKGNAMDVGAFAVFLEDHIGDVAAPGELPLSEAADIYIDRIGGRDKIASPSQLVELSKGLSINENAAITDHRKLATGESNISFSTEHTGANGAPISIPTSFQIAIPVVKDGPLYAMVARLRYRVNGAELVFWYDLWRPDLTFDHAFAEALDEVRGQTGLEVLLGSPEA